MEKIEYEKIKHINQMKIGGHYEITCLTISIKDIPEDNPKKPGTITVSDGQRQSDIGVFLEKPGYDIISKELINTLFTFKLYGGEFNDRLSPSIRSCTRLEATEEEKAKYLPMAPISSEKTFSQILADVGDNTLVEPLYKSNELKLKHVAAGEKNHHAYIGGLLYHTCRMARVANNLLRAKEALSRDGAFEKAYKRSVTDALTQKVFTGLSAELQENKEALSNLKASLLIALSVANAYPVYTDLKVIIPAVFLCVFALEKNKEKDEYLGIPVSEAYGSVDIFRTKVVDDMNLGGKKKQEGDQQTEGDKPQGEELSEEDKRLRRERLNEIHFCCARAFSPIKGKLQAHTVNSVIVYYTVKLLEAGFVEKDIDSDILLSAVALHDIGKIEELETSVVGATEYTPAGQSYGHLALGMEIVRKKAESGEYDPRLIANVLHCIASHHGFIEWGALAEPQTIEAKILFILDMIDSRVEPIETEYEGMDPGEARKLTNNSTAVKAPVPDIDSLLETQPENKSDTAR